MMNKWPLLTPFHNSEIENRIKRYRDKFEIKSEGFVLPEIKYLKSYMSRDKPSVDYDHDIFIAVPIKNQEGFIVDILKSVINHTRVKTRIALLFDNCTDSSEIEIIEFIEKLVYHNDNLLSIDLLQSDGDLFESTCENLLFSLSDEPFYMSLQADIDFQDYTFIPLSLYAFQQFPSLFAISGRARTSFERDLRMAQSRLIRFFFNLPRLFFPRWFRYQLLGFPSSRKGYFGDLANPPKTQMLFTKKQRHTLYTGDSIIRGPIIWRASTFNTLNGFNDLVFYLGRDDTDICLRARFYLEMHVAYLPCKYFSEPSRGTTRKIRTAETVLEMSKRDHLSISRWSLLGDYWRGEIGKNSFSSSLPRKIFLDGFKFHS
jgi:hypothetical protein